MPSCSRSSGLRYLLQIFLFALLPACKPVEPLRIGYITAMSGSGTGLGIAGRNGATLAIEQTNASGGIKGRRVELITQDSAAEGTATAIETLAARSVSAAVGALSSREALAMAPIAEHHQLLMISPTASANELVGKDDLFFRLGITISKEARHNARFIVEALKKKRPSIIYDLSNPAYTEAYAREFNRVLMEYGGSAKLVDFDTLQPYDPATIIDRALSYRPDLLILVANPLNAARLALHAKQKAPELMLFGSDWAGNDELIEMAGNAVEGMHVGQYFDRADQSPRYLAFKADYRKRFGTDPGFTAATSYDATRILLEALARRSEQQTLKNALLEFGPYPGLQHAIRFDRYGDAAGYSGIAQIKNKQFEGIPWP